MRNINTWYIRSISRLQLKTIKHLATFSCFAFHPHWCFWVSSLTTFVATRNLSEMVVEYASTRRTGNFQKQQHPVASCAPNVSGALKRNGWGYNWCEWRKRSMWTALLMSNPTTSYSFVFCLSIRIFPIVASVCFSFYSFTLGGYVFDFCCFVLKVITWTNHKGFVIEYIKKRYGAICFGVVCTVGVPGKVLHCALYIDSSSGYSYCCLSDALYERKDPGDEGTRIHSRTRFTHVLK